MRRCWIAEHIAGSHTHAHAADLSKNAVHVVVGSDRLTTKEVNNDDTVWWLVTKLSNFHEILTKNASQTQWIRQCCIYRVICKRVHTPSKWFCDVEWIVIASFIVSSTYQCNDCASNKTTLNKTCERLESPVISPASQCFDNSKCEFNKTAQWFDNENNSQK